MEGFKYWYFEGPDPIAGFHLIVRDMPNRVVSIVPVEVNGQENWHCWFGDTLIGTGFCNLSEAMQCCEEVVERLSSVIKADDA